MVGIACLAGLALSPFDPATLSAVVVVVVGAAAFAAILPAARAGRIDPMQALREE